MKQDEFNNVKISNVDEFNSFEFGPTPKVESESYEENEFDIHDEVNDNPTFNSENEPEEKKRQEDKEQQEQSSSREESNSSGNSSSSSSSSSSSAASGASAASAAAVGASVAFIAVASLGALVGLDITGAGGHELPSGSIIINNMLSFPDRVWMRFNLTGNDGETYVVQIVDSEYSPIGITLGKNEVEFSSLEPSKEYVVQFMNGTRNNEVIAEQTIYTLAEDEASFTIDTVPDSIIDDEGIERGSFELLLGYNYYDENFSSFSLHITDSEGGEQNRRIEATEDQQTVYINEQGDDFTFNFDDPNGLTFTLSYYYGNDPKTTTSHTVRFDTSVKPTKYTVTFKPGDAQGDILSLEYREGQAFYFPECPYDPPAGYMFEGWKVGLDARVWEPGQKYVRRISRNYTCTASFVEDTTPNFDTITFSDSIDFTTKEHSLEFNISYSSGTTYYVAEILFELTNTRTGQSIEQSISLSSSETEIVRYVSITDNDSFYLTSGDEFEYRIHCEYLGEDFEIQTGTVNFVDVNERTAVVKGFQFTEVSDASGSEHAYFSVSYDDSDFEDGFFTYYIIDFTPVEGGSTIRSSGAVPTSDTENMVENLTGTLDYTGTYVYEFSLIDTYSRQYGKITGIVDFSKLVVQVSSIFFGEEAFDINNRTYIEFNATIYDYGDRYGQLSLQFIDESDPDNPVNYDFSIEKRSGKQIIDVTDMGSSALTSENLKMTIIDSNTGGALFPADTVTSFYFSPTAVYPSLESGAFTSFVLSKDNLEFDIDLLRSSAGLGSYSTKNGRLVIGDSSSNEFVIQLQDSDISTAGLTHLSIEVPSTYEQYDELISFLQLNKATVKIRYDRYENSTLDVSDIELTVCTDQIFNVR